MNKLSKLIQLISIVLLSSFLMSSGSYAAEATPLFSVDLPNIPGEVGEILTVEYQPGEASNPHRHNANTFVYVLEGSVVMGVAGGEPKTLVAGETFYESPDDIHSVSKNASNTETAKILVFFVKKKGAPGSVQVNN